MNLNNRITGLINIKNTRGLVGSAARDRWIMEAIEVLLLAELLRSTPTPGESNGDQTNN